MKKVDHLIYTHLQRQLLMVIWKIWNGY